MADIELIRERPSTGGDKIGIAEQNIQEQAKDVRKTFNGIQEELEQHGDLKDGLSFLDMKNDVLLSYLIDSTNIILKQMKGESIDGHQSVDRCVEYRIILEKIKGIDQRLAYQLKKLITMPDNAEEERIVASNLDVNIGDSDDNEEVDEAEEDSNDDDDEEGDGEDDDNSLASDSEQVERAEKSDNIYRPPKLRSVGDRSRRNHEFYEDANADEHKRKHNLVDEDVVKYEEDNYTRLPTKRAKRKLHNKNNKGKVAKRNKRR